MVVLALATDEQPNLAFQRFAWAIFRRGRSSPGISWLSATTSPGAVVRAGTIAYRLAGPLEDGAALAAIVDALVTIATDIIVHANDLGAFLHERATGDACPQVRRRFQQMLDGAYPRDARKRSSGASHDIKRRRRSSS
jgi:hypothetical protein